MPIIPQVHESALLPEGGKKALIVWRILEEEKSVYLCVKM